MRQDAFRFLRGAPREFDFIYVAPPQYAGLWAKALQALDAAPGWLAEDGEIIVQIDPSEFQALTLKNFELVEERKYGKTLVCFYQRPEDEV
ncbi:MAG: RsmD family RNA methyltransferase [Anaerolineae bacterium]|nr:RsmD family RNA methyltransferase [Anaerolineae bacterium]